MINNRLLIVIDRPIDQVFAFTIDPKKSPLWVDTFVKEYVDKLPIQKGTIYRNLSTAGNWAEYSVTAFEHNHLFELTAQDKKYHVRYTFEKSAKNSTKLVYYEWVNSGQLDEPFTLDHLNKLKAVIEKTV